MVPECKPEIREKVKGFVNNQEVLNMLSSLFKVLGDPTRLKIIYALSLSEMNVSEMVDLLEMTQSSISHQLQLLRREKLIKFKKEGRKVYYSLDDDHVLGLFHGGLDHAKHKCHGSD